MAAQESPRWAKNMFGEPIGIEAYATLARENREKRLGEKTVESLAMESAVRDARIAHAMAELDALKELDERGLPQVVRSVRA